MLGDSINSRKAFSASCRLWKLFSLQKVVKMLEEVVVGEPSTECGGWGPTLFNFWSIGSVMYSQALWRRLGPFCWPVPASCRHCSFRCISEIYWAYFSDVLILPGFRKLQWIRWAADHQTVTMTFFWCKFGFGKCFGASSWSNHWAGHRWLSYKIHFSLYVTGLWHREMVHCCCTE